MGAREILQLHPLLADRVRLAIMAALASASEGIDFTTLLESLSLSRGNLSSHLRKLEQGDFITVEKHFVDRVPRSTYRCTAKGSEEIKRYLHEMERALKSIG